MKKILSDVLSFFFPPLCVICQSRLMGNEQHLCVACIESLPKTDYHNQQENRLEHFFGGKFPFERAVAFCYFYKEGGVQKVVHEFKYKNNPQLAEYVGALYGSDLNSSDFIKGVDYLVPVPLHKKRERTRGYNQALEICKGISATTQVPTCLDAICRSINNPSQTKNTKVERWENVQGIFSDTKKVDLNNKHILLVDDVITTGSTIEAIVSILSSYQNLRISIAAFGVAM